ncbi:MAG: carbamoyl-phosphate synthase large subunit, partial [Acidimicrobiia bacterium]|nr:carbamoyl-phosphate synthase large subunit [Acidimicrobiia bacterium]
RAGLNADPAESALDALTDDELLARAALASPDRPFQLEAALRRGISVERLHEATAVDPWFLDQILRIVEQRATLVTTGLQAMTRPAWRRAKRLGFADAQLAWLWGAEETRVRSSRLAAGVAPTYKTVDTCSAEFEAHTPYHYSTWEDEDEVGPGRRPKVVILGSGPNRIGQGIEFDYCCVHASFALRDAGFETVMVNCNPETVSTDYDTSDRLYFEPLTAEDVLAVLDAEAASGELVGVIVSLGGQTPLKLAGLVPPELVLGTSPDSIDLAEDRERWSGLCERLGIPQPPGGVASTVEDALAVVGRIDYPALVRPSYVLGGRAMSIVYDDAGLVAAMAELATFGAPGGAGAGSLGREGGLSSERPVLIDRFLEDAVEVDVDAVRDVAGEVLIGAVMEHVEEAGVHSGDSACAIPPPTLSAAVVQTIEGHTRAIAQALGVRGLLNVQYAVQQGEVFVIEANPRASRTVPFVSKATGVPLAKVAARVMLGATLAELRAEGLLKAPVSGSHVAVKEAVLPFNRFPEVDTLLGPEMRSTGEVMGIDRTFGLAFAKSQIAAGDRLPEGGAVFLSLADRDKEAAVGIAAQLQNVGFRIVGTRGTARALSQMGVRCEVLNKVGEGSPHVVDWIECGDVDLVINTPTGSGARADGYEIRKAAVARGIPCITTVSGGFAAAGAIVSAREQGPPVVALQDVHAGDPEGTGPPHAAIADRR